MQIYNIFFSPTGGTKKVADIITNVISNEYVNIDLIQDNSALTNINFEEDDIVIVSVPSFSGRIPSVIPNMFSNAAGNKARAILVCVYGNRAYEDTLIELKDVLKSANFTCLAAVAANAEHSIMHEFGANRPDADDIAELINYANKIKEKLDNDTYSQSIDVPGNRPYKEVKKGSMLPEPTENCINCGSCALECPTAAISKTGELDKDKCIGCMHCITVCPMHSRKVADEIIAAATERMRPLLSSRKNNELFI